MWHIGVPSSLGVVTTFAYNVEYAIIRREVRSGMYCTHHKPSRPPSDTGRPRPACRDRD